ncbi:F-box/kelch-repeat protein At1g80440 [Beta vulgaris subsp. vulgaris]|uniref:F-box/kelch-repeat protein At1g80440 n=1 Tax=Beta vulgaris subsp. vulgaris TaxID=3555 RepID=UPI0025483D34|nr:F-box/kelch-repeat protein At1g80440 [Beta vulgaris subsp. vulgaris]
MLEMDSIIPGLIDDLGRECLIRVPFYELPTATSVCKKWKSEITLSEFRVQRKRAGVTRPIIVLAQAQSEGPNENSDPGVKQHPSKPTYQLTVSDPTAGTWGHLPPIPGLPEGLPMFSGLVGSGSCLVVIGGWDLETWKASKSVYIYNFLSGKWRRGEDMPGVRRSFFGCAASDDDRTVIIAGGHDEDKNALSSVMLYDVEEDKWVPLPDMSQPRDECKAIFQRGSFHVISGYPTDMQGCFVRSAESFSLSTWKWGPVVEEFLEAGAGPGLCVAGPDGRVYACIGRRSGDVAVRMGDRWQVVAEVPADVRSSHWMNTYGDKLVVIGCSKFGEPQSGYMLDLKNYKWTKIDVPKKFSGHVQCGFVLEL